MYQHQPPPRQASSPSRGLWIFIGVMFAINIATLLLVVYLSQQLLHSQTKCEPGTRFELPSSQLPHSKE